MATHTSEMFLKQESIPVQDRVTGVKTVTLFNSLGLENRRGVVEVANAMLNGGIVVGDYYSTFGLQFLDDGREKAAAAKGEASTKPVSVVTTLETMLRWVDWDKIHPEFKMGKDHTELFRKFGKNTKNTAFNRIPANEIAINATKYGVSEVEDSEGNVQHFMHVLLREDNDPLLRELRSQKAEQTYYLVTSLNPHKELERYDIDDAYAYAEEIKASYFVPNNPDALRHSRRRIRLGSIPIIQVPLQVTESEKRITGAGEFVITRAANTHPESISRVIKEIFPWARVIYQPKPNEENPIIYSLSPDVEEHRVYTPLGTVVELKEGYKRRQYYSLPDEPNKGLNKILFSASAPKK